MSRVQVLILRAAGTNCDLETQHAWELAGAQAVRLHIRQVIEQPALLRRFQILTIPGGFSYGDDIAAGRIFAAQLQRHLLDDVREFIDCGKLVLGICNGFQVLVQAGLLPFRLHDPARRTCAVTTNDPPGFQDRWVYLQARSAKCVFLEPGRLYELPIAHGEGRVVFATDSELQAVLAADQHALAYTGPPPGRPNLHGQPLNPNGSAADIGGLCDESGRVLGLMPHPERFVAWTQHPCWTSELPRAGRPCPPAEGDGLALFRRAVAYFQ